MIMQDLTLFLHVMMPAAIDAGKRRWRTKISNNKTAYLFNHKALANFWVVMAYQYQGHGRFFEP